MATLYVNANTGNNSNNGTTWALAKLTLAGVNSAATAGDTIYAHGIFYELLPVTKQLNWIGFGVCVFDQNGGACPTPSANTTFLGVNFRNSGVSGAARPASGASFTSCIFFNSVYGLYVTGNPASCTFTDCLFTNCSTAGLYAPAGSFNGVLTNCTFAGNGTDILALAGTFQCNKCSFGSLIMINNNTASVLPVSATDNNVYDFTAGKCIFNAVDKTTISAWRTSLGTPRDANSIDRAWTTNEDVGDFANGSYRSPSGGYLLTAGPGGAAIGLLNKSYTISNNTHASSGWTSGGTFSNTTVDGSGNLVLVGAATSGTWTSAEIDFGVPVNILRIETQATGEVYPTTYLDTDTGDSPGFLNVEVYGSNSASGTPTFVAVPRRGEVANVTTNLYRYWTVRLTLRKP